MLVSYIINVQLRVLNNHDTAETFNTITRLASMHVVDKDIYIFSNKTLSSLCVDIALRDTAVSLAMVPGCHCRRRDSGDP